jgi:hypothetical protein
MTVSDTGNGSHDRGCHGFGVFDKAVSSIKKYALQHERIAFDSAALSSGHAAIRLK